MEKDDKIERPAVGYVGTYFSEDSRGIYRFEFYSGSGEVTRPELFFEAQNAKWVSLYENSLIFPIEKEGHAGVCFLRLKDGRVESSYTVLEETQTPCYILQDESFVYTANYHEGTVMIYSKDEGGLAIIKRIENGPGAGCHQILIHGQYLLVPCLEQNRIRLFHRNEGFVPAGEISFPEGSGPRHGVFNREHTKLYVISEWSNELFVFNVQGGRFELKEAMSILSEERSREKAASAAIRLTGDERFLYISIRGLDLLAALDVSGDKVRIFQYASCGGIHPRDFILSPDERFILVANRYEGGIVSMERDRDSGLINGISDHTAMAQGVSLTFDGIAGR